MDVHLSQSSSTILLILTLFLFLPFSKSIVSDYSSLVYKSCATQTFNDQSSRSYYSQTLNSIFQQLIAHSTQSKFFKTKELIDDDTSISGFFQCRNDITNEDCFTCVNLLPQISNTLCGDSTSARVQLHGCYIQYKTEKLPETTDNTEYSESESSSNLLFHKECGVPAVVEYVKFEESMEEAFVNLESGILNGNGYYSLNYRSVKLMAQCEGDLENCECGKCVSDAIQVAKEECGDSISAQIYLDKCFMSYIFESDVNPGKGGPGASRNSNTQKLAAIIVGGAAALFLGFILLSLLNSRFKKDDFE